MNSEGAFVIEIKYRLAPIDLAKLKEKEINVKSEWIDLMDEEYKEIKGYRRL